MTFRSDGDLDDVIDFLPAMRRTRSTTDKNSRPRSLTQLAHNVIRRIVQPGDTVIDATAGNGNDTHVSGDSGGNYRAYDRY